MPELRCVKRALAICALLIAGSASAKEALSEMADVREAGHWSGCVFQEGFDPYPIRISPRPAPTLKVEYPGICSGYHTPRQKGWPNDAVEVITDNTGTCIETVELNYSLEGGLLRIDYGMDDGAYALLLPVAADSKPYTCDPSGATS